MSMMTALLLSTQMESCVTLMMLASIKGHGDVVDELLATKSVILDQLSGVSQCIPQYQYCSDQYVVCYPQDGAKTALILASKYGHLHNIIVKKLIKAGTTVDKQNKVGTHSCHTSL